MKIPKIAYEMFDKMKNKMCKTPIDQRKFAYEKMGKI